MRQSIGYHDLPPASNYDWFVPNPTTVPLIFFIKMLIKLTESSGKISSGDVTVCWRETGNKGGKGTGPD